jgi:hypothetical protein
MLLSYRENPSYFAVGQRLGVHHQTVQRCVDLIEGFFSKFARSVLRQIRVASKQELKERIAAGIEDVNRHPVIHTWSYKLAEAA